MVDNDEIAMKGSARACGTVLTRRYITKLGHMRLSWKRRYAVLRGNTLYYFKVQCSLGQVPHAQKPPRDAFDYAEAAGFFVLGFSQDSVGAPMCTEVSHVDPARKMEITPSVIRGAVKLMRPPPNHEHILCVWNAVDRGRTPRIFYLMCDTEVDAAAWFRALTAAVTAYRASPEGKAIHAHLLEQNLQQAGYDARQIAQIIRAQVHGEGLRRSDKGETAMSHLYARQSIGQANIDLVASAERLRLAKQARAQGGIDEVGEDGAGASAGQTAPPSQETQRAADGATSHSAAVPTEDTPEVAATVVGAGSDAVHPAPAAEPCATPSHARTAETVVDAAPGVAVLDSAQSPPPSLCASQAGPASMCMTTFHVTIDGAGAEDSEL